MNVEKVIPKSLEPEKAAEYALAVCEEDSAKAALKQKSRRRIVRYGGRRDLRQRH